MMLFLVGIVLSLQSRDDLLFWDKSTVYHTNPPSYNPQSPAALF